MRFWPRILALYLAGTTAAGYGQRPLAPPGADPAPSDPQPTFRSAIDIVRLDVSVLDKERLPIRGLTAADFTVLEDGKVQSIVAFDAVDMPDSTEAGALWMRAVAPDVVTNRYAAQRVIVIILDDFNVPIDLWAVQSTKTIARAVIDHMGPEDLAAVVYTVNQHNGQEFTTDRARLVAAVDRFVMPFG
jgi:VWFA-related protein